MKKILLFGAGKSASVLIKFLSQLAVEKQWLVTVADNNAQLLQQKVQPNQFVQSVQLNIEDDVTRQSLIKKCDLVISMMPPALHYSIALDCITLKKHLLTASYTDEQIKKHAAEIKDNNLIFLYEMGLDPGIDHMSAMKIIHHIQEQNGTVTSFKSHCGGLIAPESDDNPWHYKISWNPRNIILAGKAGAVYKLNNQIIQLPYESLFNHQNLIQTTNETNYAYYANRDSLSYINLYGLENAANFLRTTLRHPEFILGWKNIIELQLTNEEKVYETDGMSIASFFSIHFKKYGFDKWIANMVEKKLSLSNSMLQEIANWMKVDEKSAEIGEPTSDNFLTVDENGNLKTSNINTSAAAIANNIHEVNISLQQLFYLGLEDETLINKGLCSAADILQFILEQKLALQPNDKDLIVMIHEIEYTLASKKYAITSTLELKGENNIDTAMAKTVGFPLGIAAQLILENKINCTGLHIPTIQEIYNPVLEALAKQGIHFNETFNQVED